MTNKKLKKYLLKEGFENIGGDNTGTMYETEHICIFLYNKNERRRISFGHSADGNYVIANANIDQIKGIITLFKHAIFSPCELGKVPKVEFKLSLLRLLDNFFDSQPTA